jgi:hypothetical protein
MSAGPGGPHPARMTAWIVLAAVTVLFALALRRGPAKEPPLPPGYEGERQLAELRAMIASRTTVRLP